jgi:hypothetical protein
MAMCLDPAASIAASRRLQRLERRRRIAANDRGDLRRTGHRLIERVAQRRRRLIDLRRRGGGWHGIGINPSLRMPHPGYR